MTGPISPTSPAELDELPVATVRRLVEASVSPNTRRNYVSALRRLDAWLDGRRLDDHNLAAYLAELHDQGRAPASASTAVAAARFWARLAGEPSPAGERTARVLAGYRRTAADRGRGQARPFQAVDLAAVLATCHRPRQRGRGVESGPVALERGRVDAVIAGLLFMAGMRRSEVGALRWTDIADAADGDGVLVTVRRSKTSQDGGAKDVRFVKGGVASSGPARAARAAARGLADLGGRCADDRNNSLGATPRSRRRRVWSTRVGSGDGPITSPVSREKSPRISLSQSGLEQVDGTPRYQTQ